MRPFSHNRLPSTSMRYMIELDASVGHPVCAVVCATVLVNYLLHFALAHRKEPCLNSKLMICSISGAINNSIPPPAALNLAIHPC